MRREALARALLVLLVAAFAGLAWLTRHPDSPWLGRVAGWPVVGPLAERFRAAYSPPPGEETEAPPAGPRYVLIPPVPEPEDEGEGAPSSAVASERVASPGPAAGPPPLGREPEPVRPVSARPAARERVARVERLLGERAARSALGPYALVYDVGASAPLERWSALAALLDASYAARYGVSPVGRPAETVAIFAREADYRALEEEDERLAGLDASGHASAGLAALWTEGRSRQEAESTLVHELAHFLQRRALGPALPPWLDEGLAEDLAQTPFEGGDLVFGTTRIDIERDGPRTLIRGGLAALDEVDRAALEGRLPSLERLVGLDWREFVGPEAKLHYGEALWFVRYLLDGGDPARAAGFRGYLAAIARGEPADGGHLMAALDSDWGELDAGFRAWLREERQRRLIALGLPSRHGPEPAVSGDPR